MVDHSIPAAARHSSSVLRRLAHLVLDECCFVKPWYHQHDNRWDSCSILQTGAVGNESSMCSGLAYLGDPAVHAARNALYNCLQGKARRIDHALQSGAQSIACCLW